MDVGERVKRNDVKQSEASSHELEARRLAMLVVFIKGMHSRHRASRFIEVAMRSNIGNNYKAEYMT